jgi:hypothetical protein
MGKFYRGGKLVSADTFNPTGLRTLAAATEADLWAGTAAARPSPGGVQVEVVSTSVDDDQTRAQKGTITIAGTMDAPLTDEWDGTVGGVPMAGDVCRLTLDGSNYDYLVEPGDVAADIATGVKDAAMSGSFDSWQFTIGAGGLAAGDIVTLTINATPYTYAVQPGDTAALVAAGLAAAAAADPLYTVANPPASANVTCIKILRGVGSTVTCAWTTDPGADNSVTSTHTVTGIAAQTAWTVTTVGADVNVLHATSGATADTAAGSATGGTTFGPLVHTVTGADPDTIAVDDGTTVFSYDVRPGDALADVAAQLAALIDADAAYIATSALGVVTVEAAVAGTSFTFADASVDNQTADLSVTIDNDGLVQNGDGPGVRAVRVDYLDTSGVLQWEIIDLNGTTATASVATDIDEIIGVVATEVGSLNGAAGTISVRGVGGGTQFDVVSAGRNEALSAVYAVPLRQRAWVTALQLSAGATATTVRLKSDTNPATGAIVANGQFTWRLAVVGTDPVKIDPTLPIGPFPAGARIWLTGTHAAGTACQGQIEGYLEPSQAGT